MRLLFIVILLSTLGSIPRAGLSQTPDLVPAPEGFRPALEITAQALTLRSAILGETRRVFVVLPASFAKSKPTRRYPVTILTDGEFETIPIATVARELSREGPIPEMVLVGIENTNRLRDLTPPGLSVSGSTLHEGGDRFLDFIERELLPALDRQFRTTAPRTLAGHSSGGILVTYAAATRSTFRNIVAIDTPTELGANWLPLRVIARAASGPPPLHYASYESRFGWDRESWQKLLSAAPPSWKLHHEQLAHESHNSMTLLAAYLGLREVFLDYSKLAAPVFPTTSILGYYQTLTPIFGAPLEPPESLLRDVCTDLLGEGRGVEARAAFDRMVASYGEPADAAALRREIAEVERRPPPAETVESLLATPFPSPEEAKEYLGEWAGESWMSPENRHPITLRIRAAAGRVAGEVIMHPEPGVDLVQELRYLKIADEEFTYGFLNGMRPRGVLLYTLRRRGDRFEGIMRWGGVVPPRRPDGKEPPTVHLELRKVSP
jgi:uncharacterized protein